MAIIAGVTVEWTLSPRIILIPVAETEITLEDLQDTLQDLEDDETGIVFKHLREMSGGEDLGGGTAVGFTMELQNAIVGWKTNYVQLETGTVTTPDTTGETLTDSAATFSTNGVVPGDMVYNSTDGSRATILDVVSETEVRTDGLVGGTDDQFDSSDAYEVLDWEVRNITGGNLVAVDSVPASIDPVFPSFGNTVVRTSSSSATIANQADAEFSSFANQVCIDPISGVAGTGRDSNGFLIGTRQAPSSNMTDAKTIADTRGIHDFNLITDLTLTSEDLSAGYLFTGDSTYTILSVNPGADVSNCAAVGITIEGEFDGFNTIRDCSVGTVTNLSGFIEKSAFQTTASLSGNTSLFETYSQVVGTGHPVITPGSVSLIVRDHHGSLGIAGMTGGSASIGVYGGGLVVEASCTGGTIYARGEPYEIIDNSTGTTVVDQTDSEKVSYIRNKMLTVAKFIGLK